MQLSFLIKIRTLSQISSPLPLKTDKKPKNPQRIRTNLFQVRGQLTAPRYPRLETSELQYYISELNLIISRLSLQVYYLS